MPKARQLHLSQEQRRELEQVRDHHPKPDLRTKAAALLKVAAGQSMRQVALHGLLKRYDDNTIRTWIERYEQEGLQGLHIRAGRGRKPAFSPCRAGYRASGV